MADLEYDKSTAPGPTRPAPTNPDGPHSTSDKRANLRVDSKPGADISILASPITFPFSKRTAMNRFLKAPMTERLCP